jgi:hypothetical protein
VPEGKIALCKLSDTGAEHPSIASLLLEDITQGFREVTHSLGNNDANTAAMLIKY